MSWLFSRALVAGFSVENFSGGKQFAPSSAKPTPELYSSDDKTKDTCRLSRFGMMCGRLTEQAGEELLMSFRAAFPVKTSVPPEMERESKASVPAYGARWRELSVRYDRVSCSWKTHQCLFEEVLPASSLTFPRSGMIQGGVLWEQMISERRIEENGFGSWVPTPNAWDAKRGALKSIADARERKRQITLVSSVKHNSYPTPRSSDGKGSSRLNAANKCRMRGYSPNLQEHIAEISGGGKLNPRWVEWLMGWPIGWSSLERLGTDKFQSWLKTHGAI